MNIKRATALAKGEDADGRGSWMGSLPTGPHLGTAIVDISHKEKQRASCKFDGVLLVTHN